MKSHRNLSDGLWNIPIVTKLKYNNYKMPPTYPLIYIASYNILAITQKSQPK